MVTETLACAKINLALHVTGQRGDGYHLLDSLVVFAGIGDRLSFAPALRLSLTITGPQAARLGVRDDNLVLRAARLIGPGRGVAITLEKQLPVGSGIGGGSADAAATLRALAALWQVPWPSAEQVAALGADVPVCLAGRPARMSGVGDVIAPLTTPLPAAWLVLANPGIALATRTVFRALMRRDNAPLPATIPGFADAPALQRFLAAQRNDLEAAAIGLCPQIAMINAGLTRQPGCLLARMSGSGATCFGLFATAHSAAAAARALQRAEPGWWVAAAAMLS